MTNELTAEREARMKEALLDEDWLEEIIADSVDMDWRPRDAAKLIIERFAALQHKEPPA